MGLFSPKMSLVQASLLAVDPGPRAEPKALTAAATRSTTRTSQEFRQLVMPWQQQALGYYQTVGECWYAAQFYARTLKKVRTFAAIRDENGEFEELPPEHAASQAWDRVQDPGGGGRGQLQASYGQLQFLIGDGYLTVTQDPFDDEEEAWEYLSPNELRVQPGRPPTYARYAAPGLPAEQLYEAPDSDFEPVKGPAGKSAVVYRLFRRDPQYSKWADSPMRGVLKLFEELLLLELAVGARARSRAAGAGILYVPTELSFGAADHANNDDPKRDPFMEQLQAAMTTPIKDPGSASSVVPFVIRGPARLGDVPAKEALFHLPIHDPMETYPEEQLRAELIRRIAQGLDIPAEVLLGMSDANHWTAWQIDEASWTAHVQPMCEQMCGDFGAAYLRPACKKANVEDWRNIVVGYDAAEIVNHPDRVKDAEALHRAGGLSYETWREVAGFTEDDAPDEDEHNEWLAIELHDASFIPGHEKQPVPGQLGPDGQPLVPGATQPGEVAKVPPDTQEAAPAPAEVPLAASAALVQRVVGAAELAVERTRELAGSRLRSKAKGCVECRELIDPVGNSLVAAALGAERVEDFASIPVLTAGGTDSFKTMLGRWGVPVDTVEKLAALVERHAASHLLEGQAVPLPRAFAGYVEKVL